MTDLANTVRDALRRLAPPGSRILVATSGGPDSQALLDLLARVRSDAGIEALWAIGVDHGLRPGTDAELDLAEKLATGHGVSFERFAVELDPSGNLMAAARRARYAALRRAADRLGADRIAVAHTATDQIESILLNVTRGAGLRGAGGIRPRRGRIIRPLLEVSRQEICDYVEKRGIPTAEDPSNFDPRRARAELRAHVLPALRRINPKLESAFGRFSAVARIDDAHLTATAKGELKRRLGPLESLDLDSFRALDRSVASRLLRLWLGRHGLKARQSLLMQLLRRSRVGRVGLSISGAHVRTDAGRLWAIAPQPYAMPLPLPGRVAVQRLGWTISGRLDDAETVQRSDYQDGSAVAFDADRLHLDIEVRSWKVGDRLRPFGLEGQVKIGDLFTNAKIPWAWRQMWPMAVVDNEVVWVVGLRRGSVAPVTSDTRRILSLQMEGVLPGST